MREVLRSVCFIRKDCSPDNRDSASTPVMRIGSEFIIRLFYKKMIRVRNYKILWITIIESIPELRLITEIFEKITMGNKIKIL